MPKLNVDEKVFESIELTLDGQTYVIESITQKMFDRIKETSKEAAENPEDISVLARQLSIILDADPKKFEGLDLRKASAALRFLTESIAAQVEGKEKND